MVEGLDWDQNRHQNVDNCVFSKINCNTETKRKWRKIENSGMVVDMWCTRYWKTWTISLQISIQNSNLKSKLFGPIVCSYNVTRTYFCADRDEKGCWDYANKLAVQMTVLPDGVV